METWTEPRLLLSGSWNSEGPGGSGGPPPEPPPSCRVDSLLEPPGSVSQPRSTQRVCVCVSADLSSLSSFLSSVQQVERGSTSKPSRGVNVRPRPPTHTHTHIQRAAVQRGCERVQMFEETSSASDGVGTVCV